MMLFLFKFTGEKQKFRIEKNNMVLNKLSAPLIDYISGSNGPILILFHANYS